MTERLATSEPERATTIAPVPDSTPWAHGDVTFYRLYDIGYEIDLERVSRLLVANAPERPRPLRGEAQAIQIPNPPVTVRLGTEPVRFGERVHDVDLSARLFDFGAISLRGRIALESPRPWAEL